MQAEHAAMAMPAFLGGLSPVVVSSSIIGLAYVFIISEKINRAVVALLGAALMIFLGVLNQKLAIQGVDFNTIALLIGMMVIVGITKETGVFQYVAIMSAKAVKANPRALLAVLSLVTAIFSAFLDNVTTVMLIVPITLLLTEQLKLNPFPFLIAQIFFSNAGGAATLIGDPPNILIGSALGFSFMDFVYNVGEACVVTLIFLLIFFDFVWGRKMTTSDHAKAHLLSYNAKEAIKNKKLLVKSLVTLALVIGGFIFGHDQGLEPGSIALSGAAFLILLDVIGKDAEDQTHAVHKAFSNVEWETIFFFIGLFILVYGVEHAGVLKLLGEELLSLTGGNMIKTGYVVLWSSAILSAIVDNIPFVATMIPLLQSTADQLGGPEAIKPLWWALSLGACLGGNGSLIGASANVMVASFAGRAGHRISFMRFFVIGFPLMLATMVICHIFVGLKFFGGQFF
ncbi:MAG: ArsB/NhaD family transporter [Bdellovibrionales bacterium]